MASGSNIRNDSTGDGRHACVSDQLKTIQGGLVDASGACVTEKTGEKRASEFEEVANRLESEAYSTRHLFLKEGSLHAADSLPFLDGVPSPALRVSTRNIASLMTEVPHRELTSVGTSIVAASTAETRWWSSAAEMGVGLEQEDAGHYTQVLEQIYKLAPEEAISRILVEDYFLHHNAFTASEIAHPEIFIPGETFDCCAILPFLADNSTSPIRI